MSYHLEDCPTWKGSVHKKREISNLNEAHQITNPIGRANIFIISTCWPKDANNDEYPPNVINWSVQ